MAAYYTQLTYNNYIDSLIPTLLDPFSHQNYTMRYTFAATKDEAGIYVADYERFKAFTPEEETTFKKVVEQLTDVCGLKVVWVNHDQPHDVAIANDIKMNANGVKAPCADHPLKCRRSSALGSSQTAALRRLFLC
jgi:hypothetical protein